MTITITQADNDRAKESRCGISETERHKWDVCRFCPVAQAFTRLYPALTWLVNRSGARPAGAMSYWYSFGRRLVRAMDEYDKSQTPILGTFVIKGKEREREH